MNRRPLGSYLDSDADAWRKEFRAFTESRLAPASEEPDRPLSASTVVAELRAFGALGATIAEAAGGRGMDPVRYGLLMAEVARVSAPARTAMTIHELVCNALARWGSPGGSKDLLAPLARGEQLAAVGFSERDSGSDLGATSTRWAPAGTGYRLDGHKSWISFGGLADVFLVLASGSGGFAAFLVPADAPGLTRNPVSTVRGAEHEAMADLVFDEVELPGSALVGRPGTGLSHVAATALDFGRYCVAWGAVGIAEACLAALLEFTRGRIVFGQPLADHQLVRAQLARAGTEIRAANLLCWKAGELRAAARYEAILETLIAKNYAARAAESVASLAVRLHGARGLDTRFGIGGHLWSAKIMEIIEGSPELLDTLIGGDPGLGL